MTGVVYILTNLVNGKYYIGQARNFAQRKRQHLRARTDHDYPINRAIRKHGKSNFEFSILGNAEVGPELDALEHLWILTANATNNAVGYNLRLGGSVASFNAETRARMSAFAKARRHSLETKKRIGDAQRGRKSPEHSLRMIGRKRSPEECRKISESQKGKVIPLEVREKISRTILAKGMKMSEEHKVKISQAATLRWQRYREQKEAACQSLLLP